MGPEHRTLLSIIGDAEDYYSGTNPLQVLADTCKGRNILLLCDSCSSGLLVDRYNNNPNISVVASCLSNQAESFAAQYIRRSFEILLGWGEQFNLTTFYRIISYSRATRDIQYTGRLTFIPERYSDRERFHLLYGDMNDTFQTDQERERLRRRIEQVGEKYVLHVLGFLGCLQERHFVPPEHKIELFEQYLDTKTYEKE